MEVFYDILEENPEWRDRNGLNRKPLESWERLQSINGTTLATYRKVILQLPWSNIRHIRLPLGTNGKLTKKYPFLKGLLAISWIASRIPVLEEAFNNRIVYILTK